ncbi:HIT family protein [Desulfovibrio inopinatus]|uniref:HIT family protein n=1 Tax=Desulfovibrio inopinatus TaxID=102109 RepID=UPI0004837470|nr:HIT family protein [Desulfovibrio inopinatus]
MKDPDCIFCKIVRGEIPCAEVYATSRVLAFMDIGPVIKGHTLVIPKEHYPTLLDIPNDLGEELLDAIKRVGRGVMEATNAAGLNVGMNNHAAAGQVVFHAHFHVVPRFPDDGFKLWPPGKYDDMEEMERLAAAIRQQIK